MIQDIWPHRSFKEYALIAGFTEIGETFEQTVAREVFEESGLRVKNIRYYKSQPWGVADDILAGFLCDVDGSDTINMDKNELRIAKWVTRDEIELQSNDFSLTNEIMTMFKNGRI
ncbi:MAG: NUDIX domain-containing protein [Lachnospiraceae bacterium]|jgi:NAD+ diphosphatase|nr:NUDIX domain-containing protein [Lachnospiraceae bacterium]MEE3461700.1 NUDIX domain-containing protein [Lachnospiraceae bacterium]